MSKNLTSSLTKLTAQQRIYVQGRLDGLTQVAAAAAAGYANPKHNATKVDKLPDVQAAMVAAMQDLSEEIGFGRREAHDMLIEAYRNAATAAEQIQAVKELINLHGLAAPKQVEHKHTHQGSVSLERMETEELLKLADMEDLALEGEYTVINDGHDREDSQKALPSVPEGD